jgi:hypothetical protein
MRHFVRRSVAQPGQNGGLNLQCEPLMSAIETWNWRQACQQLIRRDNRSCLQRRHKPNE